MTIYFYIKLCIVLGALIIALMQLYLATRRSLVPGLLLPLLALALWLSLQARLLPLEDYLTELAWRMCGHAMLWTLLGTALIYAACRLLRQQKYRIALEERRKKLEVKERQRLLEERRLNRH